MNKILILGGTGMLGAPVVHRMVEDGFEVRLLARDPEKAEIMFNRDIEIVAGDVTDLDSLERALDGCSGVHISVGGPVDFVSAQNVAALASRMGLRRVSYVSGSTVSEENSWYPMTAQKVAAEMIVQACGVPTTIFCPTWPMEQLPRFVIGGQATIVGVQMPSWHWFAADDLARMVSNAYQIEAAAGKRFYIHGPEAITMEDALVAYCQIFHPEIESVTVIPIDNARAMAESTNNQMLLFFAEMMAYFKKVGEPGDPGEANRLLGPPTTTLSAWLQSMPVEKQSLAA